MHRILFPMVCTAVFVTSAIATEQAQDTVVFGGREYYIRQSPMVGYWDYGETGKVELPDFEWRFTSNRKGYEVQFEISQSKLMLTSVVGQIQGKERKNEEIIPGQIFPLIATWYTGKLFLPVGDTDFNTFEETAVMIFYVDQGVVTKTEFAPRWKPVRSWNGLDPSEEAVK